MLWGRGGGLSFLISRTRSSPIYPQGLSMLYLLTEEDMVYKLYDLSLVLKMSVETENFENVVCERRHINTYSLPF